MRSTAFARSILIFIWFFSFLSFPSDAQSDGCIFKDTLFYINFGTEENVKEFDLSSLKNYREAYTACPEDGYYTYTNKTSGCFNDDWVTLKEDHTSNDINGRMMLVNASETASDFFVTSINGFKPGSNYEFGVWLMNVCKINSGCSPLPPNIMVTLLTPSGRKLAEFKTGSLPQSDNPSWKKYFGFFIIPPDGTTLNLRMTNTTGGGCGDDFAMDDISFRECYPPPPPPPVIPAPKPTTVVKKTTSPILNKTVLKKTGTDQKQIKKDLKAIKNLPVNDSSLVPAKVTSGPSKIDLPLPLLTRKNPVVKQIETGDGDILIELYDNGEIDGDTVTIYHNNELVISHQGLSEKPISFHIKVDPLHTHHELVMVADNLGSIPPNTSLMIVTANNKRYEVFISSSEQKNAKVIIQKKE